MKSNILVMGATGTLGREVVKELYMRGVSVRAGQHTPSNPVKIKDPKVEVVEIDFNRPETLVQAMQGIDKVFLLTPFVPDLVEYTKQVVSIAKKCGVTFIVKLSVISADLAPPITIGRWHREAEKHIEDSGISFTFLRPDRFMQNFINYYPPRDGKIYLPFGEGKACFVDVRDVAAAGTKVLAASEPFGKSFYNLTGPAALSIYNIVDILTNVIGKKVTYVDIPESVAEQTMVNFGIPNWMINAMMESHALVKTGCAASISSAVKEITGRNPRTFEQFVTDHLEAFNQVLKG